MRTCEGHSFHICLVRLVNILFKIKQTDPSVVTMIAGRSNSIRVADEQWITTVLALIGKCGIAGAFAVTWLYSSELFPTVIRNSSMGTSSLCARVGGIVAPYIANLVIVH